MPPFILIALLLLAGTSFIEVFVLTPLGLIRQLNPFNWLTFAVIGLILLWCFGE